MKRCHSYRIRIVVNSLSVGGTEVHLSQLVPFLIENGFEVTILTLSVSNRDDLTKVLRDAGAVINPLPRRLTAKWLPMPLASITRCVVNGLRLCYHFLRDPHTLTHFFLPEAYLIGMLSAKICRVKAPLVMSRRSLNNYQHRHLLLRYIERWLHRSCELILVNSRSILTQLLTQEGVPQERLRLIYNGVALPSTQLRQTLIAHEDRYHIVMVANLISYKGHSDLIHALAKVDIMARRKWHLSVVGRDEGILSQLKDQVALLGLTDKVNWLTHCYDVSTILSKANLAVLPSHQEGFSNALLEYMAYGVPVIVSMVGGNREAVLHRYNGLLVPPQSPAALADAIICMMDHPKDAVLYARRGLGVISRQFSKLGMLEKYRQFYYALMTQSHMVGL